MIGFLPGPGGYAYGYLDLFIVWFPLACAFGLAEWFPSSCSLCVICVTHMFSARARVVVHVVISVCLCVWPG